MCSKAGFVSVFRINGFPILPPVITDELRKEIQIYKGRAKEIEVSIAERQKKYSEQSKENAEKDVIDAEIEYRDDDFEDEVEEELIKSLPENAEDNIRNINSTTSSFYSEVHYEHLDNTGSTVADSSIEIAEEILVIDSYEHPQQFEEDKIDSNTNTEESEKITIHENIGDSSTDLDLEKLVPDNSYLPENQKEISMEEKTLINPDEKELKRRDTSLSLQDQITSERQVSPCNLIRSNSYTLDNPSPLLLKHMAAEGIFFNEPSTSQSQPNKSSKKNLFPKEKSLAKPTKRPSYTVQKVKKSPYDIKLGSQTKKKKNLANIKCKVVKSPSTKRNLLQELKQLEISGNLEASQENPEIPEPHNETQLSEKSVEITHIQDQYNSKMQKLIEDQQAEYERLQEKFKKQQEELLKNFCADKYEDPVYEFPGMEASNNRTSTPLNVETDGQPNSSDFSHLSSSQTLYLSNTITTDAEDPISESLVSEDFYTCVNKEQLDIDNFQSPMKSKEAINSYMDRIKNNFQLKSGNIQNEILKIQTTAATKINAHVRGYLTRRLFHTMLVQSHIRTIRDTLLLILDLAHEEKMTGIRKTSEEDILLKMRVLKQLQESCNRIHDIFFVIPVKDRMEIIRRDRERLTKKQMERSLSRDASFTSQKSHLSRSSQKSHGSVQKPNPTNNLQFCSLFSVNIKGHVVESTVPAGAGAGDFKLSKERTHVTNISLSPNLPKKKPIQVRARSAGYSTNEKQKLIQSKPWR